MKKIEINLDHYYTHGYFIHGGQLASKFQENVHINSDDSDTIQFDSVDFIIPNRFRSGIEFRKDYSYRVKGIIFSNCSFSGHQDVFNRNIINSSYHTHLTFKNCKLDSLIVQSFQSVHFDNCMIKKLSLDSNREILLSDNDLEYLKLHHSRINGPLKLTGNKLSTVWLSDIQIESDLIFDKLDASIKLRNIKSKNSSISVTGCALKDNSYFEKVEASECSIRDCQEGSLKLSAIEFQTLKVYRNRCSITIENSTLSNSKVNLNKGEKLSFSNVPIQETLVFDKNSLEQINLDQMDISKVSFTGNEGNLSVANATGGYFPNLTENSFNSIELSDINQENVSWDIHLNSCKQLSLISLYLNTLSVTANQIEKFNIETSIGDLDFRIDKAVNFHLNHHKASKNSQIQINQSDSIEISKLISPILNIELQINNIFLIRECETELCLTAGQCNEFSGIEVSKGQDSTIKIDKSNQIKVELFQGNKLKVDGRELKNIGIFKSNSRLDFGVIKVKDLLIESHKHGLESNLGIHWIDSVRINSAEFSKLKLSVKHGESIDLNGINSKELNIRNSESKKIILNSINSNSLMLDGIKADELNLTTSENEKNQKLHRCEFNKSTFTSCMIRNYELTEFSLKEFSSEKLDVFNTHYKNLIIKACSDFSMGIGKRVNENSSHFNWFFEEIPEQKIEIIDSKGTNDFIFSGPPISNAFEYPSIFSMETAFRSFRVSQSDLKLVSVDDCHIDLVEINEVSSQRSDTELVLQGSKIRSLKILKTAGKLALSQNNMKTTLIEGSSLSLLSVDQCNSEGSEFDIDTFQIEESKVTEIDITDCNIRDLSISKVQPKAMKLRDLKLQNLSLDNFERLSGGTGKFELRSINKGYKKRSEVFSVSESDLTGLNFNSCYFDSFKELSVKESKLDEIKCTATLWPSSVTSEEGKDKYFEIREACRQLKFAMANHHDKVSELQFHALEMGAYRQIVKHKRFNFNSLDDRFSLWAGNSNKFGMKWSRPFGWIILSVILHYNFILLSQFQLKALFNDYWAIFNWKDFFLLFNPTHKFSSLSVGESAWGWTVLWDFLSKLWSAFFIYQIVAAFRKFRRS